MCLHVTGRANGPWNDSGGVAWATTTITSGITNRMSSGNPVGDMECNVGGCSCAGGCCWCSFLLIQSSQCWKQPSCQWTIKLFIHVSMLSFLSLVPSLSLSHTTHSYNSIYTLVHNTAFQHRNPCNTTTFIPWTIHSSTRMQTHSHSIGHLLIHSVITTGTCYHATTLTQQTFCFSPVDLARDHKMPTQPWQCQQPCHG